MSFEKDRVSAEMKADLARSRIERPNDKMIGYVCRGYHQIIKLLGEGGMGLAYLAWEDGIGEKAVVKTLKPEYANDADVRARFQQEAAMHNDLSHPSIPYLKYIDRSCDPWLLVIEFCDGVNLSEFLRSKSEKERKNRRFQRSLLRALLGIIDALAVAHSKGVVHRDIKPDNIMIITGPNGEVFMKLIDFGIAKSATGDIVKTRTGGFLGTPGFIAPEQFMGLPVGKAADIYSLGALIFEIVSGEPLNEDASCQVMLGRAIQPEYVPLRLEILPIYIRAMMSMMLAMNPEDRFGGMYELEGALRFVMRQMEIEDRRILESEGQEMQLLQEMTANNQIDGRLELIGAQRVLIRQFEIKNSHTNVTGKMAAIPDLPAPAPRVSGVHAFPSVDVSMSSLLGGPGSASNPDVNNSFLMAQPKQGIVSIPPQAQPVPVPSLVPAVSMQIIAEPSSGATKHGMVSMPPVSLIPVAPVPVVSAVGPASVVSAPLATGTRQLPSKDSGEEPVVEAQAETQPEKEDTKTRKSSILPLIAGVSIGIFFLVLAGFLFWYFTDKKEEDPKESMQSDEKVVADAPVRPFPVDASVQNDASTATAEKSVEDAFKALEETCRSSEGGQKYFDVPNFWLNCIGLEVVKIENLEKRLELLRYNHNKYCKKGLPRWERGDQGECKKQESWIKGVVGKIWARDNPDKLLTTPNKATNSQKPSPRSKPAKPKPRR